MDINGINKDMKEQVIQFETAKLAREKGFNEYVNSCHCINSSEQKTFTEAWLKHNYNSGCLDEYGLIHYSAPTQAFLQKWLREIYDIHIYIIPLEGDLFDCEIVSDKFELDEESEEFFDTYELALEYGLMEGLKLILWQ